MLDRSISRLGLIFPLILSHTALYVVALIYASLRREDFQFPYYPEELAPAILIVAPFCVFAAIAFSLFRFSFGYVVSYYFYMMIGGFLWINEFTALPYNHLLAGISAIVSATAFGLPALLIRDPVNARVKLSPAMTEFVLIVVIGISAVVILV